MSVFIVVPLVCVLIALVAARAIGGGAPTPPRRPLVLDEQSESISWEISLRTRSDEPIPYTLTDRGWDLDRATGERS